MAQYRMVWAVALLLLAALVCFAATGAEYLAAIYAMLDTLRHDANAFAVLSRAAKEQG